jgi:hypothetical protein
MIGATLGLISVVGFSSPRLASRPLPPCLRTWLDTWAGIGRVAGCTAKDSTCNGLSTTSSDDLRDREPGKSRNGVMTVEDKGEGRRDGATA